MNEWRNKSFFYCLAILKKKTIVPGTKIALHESALPIYNYISKYVSAYGKYPAVKHVCRKFNIKASTYYEDGWTLPAIADYVKDERARFNVTETQTTLQKLLTDGEDHSLVEYMKPMEKLFNTMTGMEVKKPVRLSSFRKINNKFMSAEDTVVAKFGFKELDKLTGGIRIANYIVLFANTNEGKSTFSRIIAGNIAMQGKVVLYITLEESAEESVVKTATILSNVPANDVFDKRMTREQEVKMKRHMRKMEGDVIFIDRCDGGVAEIASLMREHKPEVVIVDQLSHLLPDNDFDWKVINQVSKQLQQITQRSKTPYIVLHQSSKDSKKGAKSEVAWGYGMIQDADLVLYLCPDEELEGGDILKKVVIPKARGRKKNVSVNFIWNLDKAVVAEMVNVVQDATE